jgi:hypothetical protein
MNSMLKITISQFAMLFPPALAVTLFDFILDAMYAQALCVVERLLYMRQAELRRMDSEASGQAPPASSQDECVIS